MNKVILIDLWLDRNSKAPLKSSGIHKADIVCATHDHPDHLGDGVKICKPAGATFVGISEPCIYALEKGMKETIGVNIGTHAVSKGL